MCDQTSDLQMFVLKLTNVRNFQTLEVVGRGSETQLQVAKNLNNLSYQDKGKHVVLHDCSYFVRVCMCSEICPHLYITPLWF